jgi:hypothetical protein
MATDPLCHLVASIQPSMLMYLGDSGIWSYPGPESVKLALADAVDDLKNVVERATAFLDERETAVPQKAAYPLSFTALHDIDLANLLPRVIEGLRRQFTALDSLTGPTGTDAAAADLVADAKQSTRQHLDALEQLAAKLKAGLAGTAPTAG